MTSMHRHAHARRRSCDSDGRRHAPGPRGRRFALRSIVLAIALAPVAGLATGLSGHETRFYLLGSSEVPGVDNNPRGLRALASGDFDCDGVADLALGNLETDINGQGQAGSVAVAFGNPLLGLRPGSQWIHQDTAEVASTAGSIERFGRSLAVADFDGDGCSDLAVGVPGEDLASLFVTGAAHVFPGSNLGLDLARDFLVPTSGAAPHGPVGNHRKGEAIAAVNRLTSASSLPMLAIGAPGHDLGASNEAGGVSIRRSGAAAGDLATPVAFIDRNATSFGRLQDNVGYNLASGDFNGDGFGDVVAATRQITGCAVGGGSGCENENRGVLLVTYGASSASNLTHEEIHQDTPNVAGTARDGARWGQTLAVGDFDGDGFDDLAVGAPQKGTTSPDQTGSVTLLFGGAQGLRAAASRSRELFIGNVASLTTQAGDLFGDALAAGDFDRDGRDDLVIGVPGREVGSVTNAGIVILVARATIEGASFAEGTIFRRGIGGIPGPAGSNDRYGNALGTGDFNGDGVDDLAVVTQGARNAQGVATGAANLVFSTADTTTGIVSVSPSTGQPGQDYTVTVLARRTSALVTGVTRIRGTVQVRASDGSQCTVSPSPSTGVGSCTMTAGAPGVLTLTAEYPGAIGFRPSAATPRAYTVAAPVEIFFRNGFESP